MTDKYKKGDVIYVRDDGSKIVLDSIKGEGTDMEVQAHVVDVNGKAYKKELLENITKFGYWKWVGDSK